MSGYFDALMRSSGVTIGGSKPAPARFEPSAVEVDIDRSPPATAVGTVREVSTVQPALAPVCISDQVELTVPPLVTEPVPQYAHERPDPAPGNRRGAPEPAADSSMTRPAPSLNSAEPDPGRALVRAAMRWVAAGTPQASDGAHTVPAPEQPLPTVREEARVITMTKVVREDDEAQPQPPGTTPTPPAAPNLAPREGGLTTPFPIRSARIAPAPVPVPASTREDIVEVSIGAIHVRVDAPLAQTVARPAATPNASAQRAAGTTSARSALSRRALRRI
jgi:hypothetical protein